MEEQYSQEAQFVRHYTAALIDRLIALQVITSTELEALASIRANAVVEYLRKNPALGGRVSVSQSEKARSDSKENVPSRLEVTVK